jgi:WD40 repeat protein
MKALRLRLYKDKLFGHNESICSIFSPQGDKGGILVTVSKDGCLRGWDVFQRKKISKLILDKENVDSLN